MASTRQVAQVRTRGLALGLAALGGTSAAVGVGLARLGRSPGARAFGRQTAVWGLTDLAIAAWSATRPGADPRHLRTVLWVNSAADVGYLAVGAHIAFHRTTFGRWTPQEARGHGFAIVVQSLALLAFDVYHAMSLAEAPAAD